MAKALGVIADQAGKTVLITGANSGLGLQSACLFAAAGARVLMACRDADRAESAAQTVRSVAREHDPESFSLDLADLQSVRACAEQVREVAPALDVLMLNAGVMAMPRARTADGFELHFGINHLGHFALTGLLVDSVLAAPAGRVVATSSLAHWVGRLRWDDLNWNRRFYSASLAYGQSKLANLLFVAELDRRFQSAGTDALAVSAHPGAAHTNLASQAPNPIVDWIYGQLKLRISQSAAAGALPQCHAATAPEIIGADYWGPGGPLELHGAPARSKRAGAARNQTSATRLWQISEQLTGVTWRSPSPTQRGDLT